MENRFHNDPANTSPSPAPRAVSTPEPTGTASQTTCMNRYLLPQYTSHEQLADNMEKRGYVLREFVTRQDFCHPIREARALCGEEGRSRKMHTVRLRA